VFSLFPEFLISSMFEFCQKVKLRKENFIEINIWSICKVQFRRHLGSCNDHLKSMICENCTFTTVKKRLHSFFFFLYLRFWDQLSFHCGSEQDWLTCALMKTEKIERSSCNEEWLWAMRNKWCALVSLQIRSVTDFLIGEHDSCALQR
jgi:hypothetical protein